MLSKKKAIVYILIPLVLIGAPVTWFAMRVVAIGVVKDQESLGLKTEWHLPFSGIKSKPNWFKLLPTARVTAISLDYDVKDAGMLGCALKRYGPLEEVYIGQGDPGEIKALLFGLGTQEFVKVMHVFNVALDDEIGPILAEFPNLRILALVGTRYSAGDFPAFAALEELDISYAPVTDQGLLAILKCPRLRVLVIEEPAVTADGVRQIATRRHSDLRTLDLLEVALPENEVKSLEQTIKAACPDILFNISAR